MSWGIKITILYLSFVTLILTLVFICFGHKTELEYKDYYARELKFQEQIDAATNAANLAEPIFSQVHTSHILIKIPKELLGSGLTGKIILLRPSDSSKDKVLELAPDEDGTQIINRSGFTMGEYKMQILFNANGKSYFKENIINLN